MVKFLLGVFMDIGIISEVIKNSYGIKNEVIKNLESSVGNGRSQNTSTLLTLSKKEVINKT